MPTNNPQNDYAELLRTRWVGRRLARFRRVLTALLIVTGAPAAVIGHWPNQTTHQVQTILALAWLALLLPAFRLLAVEWHNARTEDALHASIYRARLSPRGA